VALPKPYRLTKPKEFSRVYQQGRQASTKHLVLKVLAVKARPLVDYPRFGITISQKVSKRAVVRNRLKRQVQSAIQTFLPRLKSGYWLVVILRTSAIECDYWQFLRELEQLFMEIEVVDGD
jgi:ribonuclease P protein component